MYILWNNFRTPYHFDPETYEQGKPISIELSEDVSFLNKAGILNTLNHLPENSKVVIDAARAKSVHTDILEIFEDFKLTADRKNIDFSVVGLNHGRKENPVRKFKSIVDNHARYDQVRIAVKEDEV